MNNPADNIECVALGELLIDLTQNAGDGEPSFTAHPGGAPANVLAMLSKLGCRASLIGRVGTDVFGLYLIDKLGEAGIDTSLITLDPDAPTALSFIHNRNDGERYFSFYREGTADTLLSPEHIKEDGIIGVRLFHFGTLSMTTDSGIDATKKAVTFAERNDDTIISFDPNLRESLWYSLLDARQAFDYGLRHANVVKMSLDELLWYFPQKNEDEAAKGVLLNNPRIKILFVTEGDKGSAAYTKEGSVRADAFDIGTATDTTGCGDIFFGAALAKLLERKDINDTGLPELKDIITYANAAAAVVATKKGALNSAPSPQEIEGMMSPSK